MPFAIFRTAKHKAGGIAGAASHMRRSRETPNADPDRTPLNMVIVGTNDAAGDVHRRVAEATRTRKDNVHAVEILMTTSPNWSGWDGLRKDELTEKSRQRLADHKLPKQAREWVTRSQNWLAETFGGEANLVHLELHLDETTPHLTGFVVPLAPDGRLSAKRYLGGSRDRMRQLQTSYHEAVADLGLERGVGRSQATHQEVSQWYGVMQSGEVPTVPRPAVLAAPSGMMVSSKKAEERDREQAAEIAKLDQPLVALTTAARAGLALQREVAGMRKRLIELEEREAEAERKVESTNEAMVTLRDSLNAEKKKNRQLSDEVKQAKEALAAERALVRAIPLQQVFDDLPDFKKVGWRIKETKTGKPMAIRKNDLGKVTHRARNTYDLFLQSADPHHYPTREAKDQAVIDYLKEQYGLQAAANSAGEYATQQVLMAHAPKPAPEPTQQQHYRKPGMSR